MKELTELRSELDQVDREIVRLFEQRMRICRGVAEYKIANGMQVLDTSREEQVLASRAGMAEDPCWGDSIRSLYTEIMALSRAEQARMMEESGK